MDLKALSITRHCPACGSRVLEPTNAIGHWFCWACHRCWLADSPGLERSFTLVDPHHCPGCHHTDQCLDRLDILDHFPPAPWS